MDIGFYRYSLFNRGGDRIIVEYANHLAMAGYEVTLHVRKLDTVFNINAKINIQTIPWYGKIGCLLYGVLHNLGHDIVIVDIVHLPLLLTLRNRVLYFAQADDIEYYRNIPVRKGIDILYRLYLWRQNPIITVSEQLSQTFSERYRFRNSHTVTNGIDLEIFYPEQDVTLIRAKGGKKAVLSMNRGDRYRKGHDLADRVFELLPKDVADKMELWVCGNQLDPRRYEFTVRNFGTVNDSRLRQILSSADIFFYPSRHEGFGLFPLEAMACGCVVVTTEAVPYARKTKCILTSQIEDIRGLTQHLERLIRNDDTFKEMKMSVIVEAKKYDLKQSKIAFESTLRAIITEKGRRKRSRGTPFYENR